MERIEFFGGSKSRAASVRRWLWGSMLLSAAIGLAQHRLGWGTVAFAVVPVFLLAFAIDWLAIRPASAGRLIAVVDDDGIESRFFDSKAKRVRWDEIQGLVPQGAGGRFLQFVLRPQPGRPDKRRFLNGLNPCRPKLALAGLDAQDHARFLAIVFERVAAMQGGAGREQFAQMQRDIAFQHQLEARVPVPTVTYVLVGLNVAAWLLTVATGGGLGTIDAGHLLKWGGNSAFEVQHGEWWRLLTAAFLHIGIMHLVMNMIGLAALGPLLERMLPRRHFLLVYFGAALAGNAASLHYGAHRAVAVGASGAIFGVAGALLAIFVFHRRHMPRTFSKQGFLGMALFVGYSLLEGAAQANVDNAAHVGGLLAGALIAALSPLRFGADAAEDNARQRGWAAAAAAVVAVVALAWTAPTSTLDQRQVLASLHTMQNAFVHLGKVGEALDRDQKDVKAGRMTALEADERSRTVHAPAAKAVLDEFRAVQLPPGHPAQPMVTTGTRMTQLLHEALAMESDVVDGKPVPARPERAKEIGAELKRLRAELDREAAALRDKR